MSTSLSKDDPSWLTKGLVRALHAEALDQFGGSMGMRDEELLDRALARPRNRYARGEPSIYELAAAYCVGIVQSKPFIFIDGNKRTGLLAARAFLFRNGYRFDPEDAETVNIIRRLASGREEVETLTRWIEKHTTEHE